ncbi:MAG: hypothetical protein ACR2HQ_04270 [Ilumatobacteraceae bacterium]
MVSGIGVQERRSITPWIRTPDSLSSIAVRMPVVSRFGEFGGLGLGRDIA